MCFHGVKCVLFFTNVNKQFLQYFLSQSGVSIFMPVLKAVK